MIGTVLAFVRRQLDDFLRAEFPAGSDPVGDKVVFPDGDKMDPLTFAPEAISLLLLNLEEDRVLRPPDLHSRSLPNEPPARVHPEIRLILNLLFVARFKQYEGAWNHLTKVLSFFQSHPLIEGGAAELPTGVERLTFELVTLRFAEQNEVWNALRATQHPSLHYRLKMVVLRDAKPDPSPQIINPVDIRVARSTP